MVLSNPLAITTIIWILTEYLIDEYFLSVHTRNLNRSCRLYLDITATRTIGGTCFLPSQFLTCKPGKHFSGLNYNQIPFFFKHQSAQFNFVTRNILVDAKKKKKKNERGYGKGGAKMCESSL